MGKPRGPEKSASSLGLGRGGVVWTGGVSELVGVSDAGRGRGATVVAEMERNRLTVRSWFFDGADRCCTE